MTNHPQRPENSANPEREESDEQRLNVHLFSDLHLEFGNDFSPEVNADVVVLAGDIYVGTKGIEWAGHFFKDKAQVIYVAGNHEFYHRRFPALIEDLRKCEKRFPHLHFLENDVVDIGGVRFLGATLWTDFELNGGAAFDKAFAQQRMNDYVVIRGDSTAPITPEQTLRTHQETRAWLESELARLVDPKKTVVVTHHAPYPRSIHRRFSGSALNSAFASNLSDLFLRDQPRYWMHGHMHNAARYKVGETEIVANPRGYPNEYSGFDENLVITI